MRIATHSNMSKFCANLAFLFPEKPFLEKYRLAKDAGFKAVETGFPLGPTKQQVVDAKNAAGIQQVLINIYTGEYNMVILVNYVHFSFIYRGCHKG